MRDKFWLEPDRWPRDTAEYMFLARALHVVGRHVFAEEWTGDEPTTPDPFGLPFVSLKDGAKIFPRSIVTASTHRQLLELLSDARPDFARKVMRIPPHSYQFDEEEWDAAAALAHEADAERHPAKSRFARVIAEIRDRLADGRFVSALRDREGGQIGPPLPSHLWNTEGVSPRFFWCQMNPADPFSSCVGGDQFDYIFLSRVSLAALGEPSPLAATTAGRKPFKEWLKGVMIASPNVRTITKADQIAEGKRVHNLSGRDAEAIREQALKEVPPAVSAAWTKTGPTRTA